MSGHARFSPSSAERWMACPGSINAQEEALLENPEQDDSSLASRTGTAAHGLLEICIILGVKPEGFLGCELEPGCPTIDHKMIAGVNVALDWLEEYVDEHGADNLIIVPERKVYIGPMIGLDAEECNGTSDLSIIHKDRSMLTTADFKNGMMAVSPIDNPQLMLYTAGDINEMAEGQKYRKYRNVIIQPNAAQRRPVNEHTFSHGKLVTFLKKAENAAQVAKLPDAPRNAGSWCFFCRAKDNCSTRRAKARAAASDEFGEWKDPEAIEPDEIEAVLEEAEFISAYVNSVKARALKMALAGHKFAGFDIGFGRRTKSFENVEEVTAWLKKKGVPQDVYAPRSMLSPTAIEKELRKMGKIPKTKRGEDPAPSPLARFISLSVPKATLKRKGVRASDDFADDVESDE